MPIVLHSRYISCCHWYKHFRYYWLNISFDIVSRQMCVYYQKTQDFVIRTNHNGCLLTTLKHENAKNCGTTDALVTKIVSSHLKNAAAFAMQKWSWSSPCIRLQLSRIYQSLSKDRNIPFTWRWRWVGGILLCDLTDTKILIGSINVSLILTLIYLQKYAAFHSQDNTLGVAKMIQMLWNAGSLKVANVIDSTIMVVVLL